MVEQNTPGSRKLSDFRVKYCFKPTGNTVRIMHILAIDVAITRERVISDARYSAMSEILTSVVVCVQPQYCGTSRRYCLYCIVYAGCCCCRLLRRLPASQTTLRSDHTIACFSPPVLTCVRLVTTIPARSLSLDPPSLSTPPGVFPPASSSDGPKTLLSCLPLSDPADRADPILTFSHRRDINSKQANTRYLPMCRKLCASSVGRCEGLGGTPAQLAKDLHGV